MYFILQDTSRPDLLRDELHDINYPVMNVVKKNNFSSSISDMISFSDSSDNSDEE